MWLIPPSFVLNDTRLTTGSSCGSLDRGGRGDVVGLGLFGGSRSLSGLGLLLSGLLLGGSILGDGLGLVLGLILSVGSSLLLVVELHSLAGLAEQTTELVALLALSILSVGGLALLLAKVTEERGAALVLDFLGSTRSLSSRGLSSGCVLGSLTLSGSRHALGLKGLASGTLDGVVELGSSAGDSRGLSSRSGGLLLSLLLRGAADLLEEAAEERSTLGLGRGLGLLLLLLLVLLFFLLLFLSLLLGLFLLLFLVLLLLLGSLRGRSSYRRCQLRVS